MSNEICNTVAEAAIQAGLHSTTCMLLLNGREAFLSADDVSKISTELNNSITAERDALRAEVERLREALTDAMTALRKAEPWAAGDIIKAARQEIAMLPNDICRCYGQEGSKICPVRDTCARYVQLSTKKYNTPAGQYLCDIGEKTFIPFYIEQRSMTSTTGEKE